jgi:pyruvate kinase
MMKIPGYYLRRTKIICTLGPASAPPAMLLRLIKTGMDIARLNLSHGTLAEHARYIKDIKEQSQKAGRRVGILVDLPGPKYRIGRLAGGSVELKKGSHLQLTAEDIEGNATLLPVTLPNLAKDIRPGDTVILSDGGIELKVTGVEDSRVDCRVTYGGLLRQGRGLVVPGMKITVPFISKQLRQDIQFAIEQKPDYIALSFVTSADDVESVKNILKKAGAKIPIISKIERGEAVKNFNAILEASDGIMIARGDLGVEIPLENVPMVQKELIKKCNRAGKPVITATEMLESMIESPRPTRAEATDVANAIFDGTDAIMLSAETSIGKYPIQVVKMMSAIARAAEKKLPYESILEESRNWLAPETDELISYSACQTAHSLHAAAIVAFTQSGSTAMRISRYRPSMPILALTPDETVAGKLMLYWGIRPHIITIPATADAGFKLGAELSRDLGIAQPGDLVIIAAGIPIGQAGSTNMLKVEKVV